MQRSSLVVSEILNDTTTVHRVRIPRFPWRASTGERKLDWMLRRNGFGRSSGKKS
jgi:hypothetical protein